MIFLMVFNVLMDESKEKQLLSLNNNIKENMEKQLLGGEVREEFFTSSERVPNPEGTSDNVMDIKENTIKYLMDESNSSSLTETLDSFNPNVNLIGEYNNETISGKIEEGNTNISLPDTGHYTINGNLTGMKVQYIQNPGAETNQHFYSENTIQAGLQLERINDGRSVEGNYAWKLYSNNTETIKYALYQKDIPFYQNNTEISYSYLLESNSSLQNILNSSLIFDFVFDTCRIMVIHWHYTNLDPPLIGDNTTIPFVVYRLLQNSSWDDQWNSYSLSMYDLFAEGDPYIPTILKSVGFYIISPEISECSILIDDFRIKSSLSPNDVDLKINDILVGSTIPGYGDFEIDFELIEETSIFEYNLEWNHSSSYNIHGNYNINITGQVTISFEKKVILFNENSIIYNLDALSIDLKINLLNLSYPDFWILTHDINGYDIISNASMVEGLNTLTLSKQGGETEIFCSFEIPNLIEDINYSSQIVFETINATLQLNNVTTNMSVNIFLFAGNNGSSVVNLEENNLIYQFPSWIPNGSIDVSFVIIEMNQIGFANSSFQLTRIPAQIIAIDQLIIPKYALVEVSVNYTSLVQESSIENPFVLAKLNNEIIPAIKQGSIFYFFISSFYLSDNSYLLEFNAVSSTHASVIQTANIDIYESNIDIAFSFEKNDEIASYSMHFDISSDNFPVGFVPLNIDINGYDTVTGITDREGRYTCNFIFSLNQQAVEINCSIMKISMVLASETFELNFDNLLAEIYRSDEETIISGNMTFSYIIQYPSSHNRWFTYISEEISPILDAYVESENLQIPAFWDSNALFWEIPANESVDNHRLILQTVGPKLSTSVEEVDDKISIHFVIEAEMRSYNNISLILHLNESFTTSKYQWQLLSNKLEDVSEIYALEINNLYVHLSNINIDGGSFLMLDLIGLRISNKNTITNIVIPLISGSGILLGAVTTVIRIYNKKKGMILEI